MTETQRRKLNFAWEDVLHFCNWSKRSVQQYLMITDDSAAFGGSKAAQGLLQNPIFCK